MNLNELVADLYDWLNKEVDVDRGTRFIRKAEEVLSNDLRIADMVKISRATISESIVRLPTDWQEIDFIRFYQGKAITLIDRESLANLGPAKTMNNCSITGNFIQFGGEPDSVNGKEVEVSYYADVPKTEDIDTWLTIRHPFLITNAAIVIAEMFYMDDVRTANAKAYVDETIMKLNTRHQLSKFHGSKLQTAFGRKRS